MKEVCLCIIKETNTVHSIGIWDEEAERYYSKEGGGWFNLAKNTSVLRFEEISFEELRKRIKL